MWKRVVAGRPNHVGNLVLGSAKTRQSMDASALPARSRAGIRQEHDWRLQSLCAMHGHDADLVALLLPVALDLNLAQAQLVDDALHGRRARPGTGRREAGT